MDLDQFENTAAWLEYSDGMTRFAAETEAAKRQGFKRHEVRNEISKRNSQGRGNNNQTPARNAAHHMPRMQPVPEKEKRSVSIRDVQAGWCGLVLLALLEFGGRVL